MLGTHRAFVVHGLDGLDEISITGPTRIAEVREGSVHSYEVTPEEFGLQSAPIEALSGGDVAENARIVREILGGERSPRRDVVLMNAAAALVAAGKPEHLKDAVALAANSVDSGSASQKLDALVRFTTANDSHYGDTERTEGGKTSPNSPPSPPAFLRVSVSPW